MIEFTGRLTENAFKYYKKTMIKTFQILLLIAWHWNAYYAFCIHSIGSVDLEYILFMASLCVLTAIFSPYLILIFAKGDVTQRIYINNGLVSAVSCEGRTRSAQICAHKKGKGFRRLLCDDPSGNMCDYFRVLYMRKRPFNKWHN